MTFSFSIYSLLFGVWDYLKCFFSVIPKVMYLLANSLSSLIDILQVLFRKLAGLDTYYVGVNSSTTNPQKGDIVMEFILGTINGKYPVLQNIFWGLIVLAIILLFLTTIIAMIRNEYVPEKDGSNNKAAVIKRSFKALFMFLVVPISVIFGMTFCNIILQALDTVTSGTSQLGMVLDVSKLKKVPVGSSSWMASTSWEGATSSADQTYITVNIFGVSVGVTTVPFSGYVFKVSGYSANRVRQTVGETLDGKYNGFAGMLAAGETESGATNFELFTSADPEVCAESIDTAFANNVVLNDSNAKSLNITQSSYVRANNLVQVVENFNAGFSVRTITRFNVGLVWYYYDLWSYNFVVAFAACFVMFQIFINICIGLMKRIIELTILFLVSPPIVAIMPLDDGKAFGNWRGKFIAKAISTYGAVVGMNLVMILLPYLNNIKFFNIAIVDLFVTTMFIIVGLVSVKGLMGLLGEIVGAEDVQKAGADMQGEVGKTFAKGMGATMQAANVGFKAMNAATFGGAGKAVGALGKGGSAAMEKLSGTRVGQGIKGAVDKVTGKTAAEAKEKQRQEALNWALTGKTDGNAADFDKGFDKADGGEQARYQEAAAALESQGYSKKEAASIASRKGDSKLNAVDKAARHAAMEQVYKNRMDRGTVDNSGNYAGLAATSQVVTAGQHLATTKRGKALNAVKPMGAAFGAGRSFLSDTFFEAYTGDGLGKSIKDAQGHKDALMLRLRGFNAKIPKAFDAADDAWKAEMSKAKASGQDSLVQQLNDAKKKLKGHLFN